MKYTNEQIESEISEIKEASWRVDLGEQMMRVADMLSQLLDARSAVVGDEDVPYPGPHYAMTEFGLAGLIQACKVAANPHQGATIVHMQSLLGQCVAHFAQSHGVARAVKVPDVLTYANQPGNVCASRLGGAARNAKPGGDSIDHGLSLLQQLQLRGFGIVPLDASQPEGKHYDAATQEKSS